MASVTDTQFAITDERFTGIVEMKETGSLRKANELLAAGYRLLDMTGTSRVIDHPRRENEVLVIRGFAWVFGRGAEDPAFPTWEPRDKAKGGAS